MLGKREFELARGFAIIEPDTDERVLPCGGILDPQSKVARAVHCRIYDLHHLVAPVCFDRVRNNMRSSF